MNNIKHDRDFKGVWIPKEIWQAEDISLVEKCLLVEIDSLDNEKGCFASNNYFSKFIGISTINISRHISKLKKLGYIKEIKSETQNRVLKSLLLHKRPLIENDKPPLSKTINPLIENDKYNNLINNSINKDNKNYNSDHKNDSENKKLLELENADDFTIKVINIFEDITNTKIIDPKEIYKIELHIKYLLKGFNNYKFISIFNFKEYCKKNKKDVSIIEEGFKSKNKFIEALSTSLQCFKEDYSPTDKSKIPTKLSSFLYNNYNKLLPSSFIHYYFFPPKSSVVEIKPLTDPNPEITKKFIDKFKLKLDMESKNRVIKRVKEMKKEHNDIVNEMIYGLPRIERECDLGNELFLRMLGRTSRIFIDHFLVFLEDKFEFENDEHAVNTICSKKIWQSFTDQLEKETGVQLYPSENYYRKFNKFKPK